MCWTSIKSIKGEHVEKKIDSGVDRITKDNARSTIEFYTKEVFEWIDDTWVVFLK